MSDAARDKNNAPAKLIGYAEKAEVIRDSGASKFTALKQTPMTSTYMAVITRKENTVTQQNVTQTYAPGNRMIVEIAGRGLGTTAHRLFLYALMVWTGSNQAQEFDFSLQEYLNAYSLQRGGKTLKQIDEDLDQLAQFIKWYSDPQKRGRNDSERINMFERVGVKNGRIILSLSNWMHDHLKRAPISQIDVATWQFDLRRNPHSPYLYSKMQSHKNMNYGKSNENRISVKKMLSAAPKIPPRKQPVLNDAGKCIAVKKNRKPKETIISPFERDMNAITAAGHATWKYCKKGGEPLSAGELAGMGYEEWEELMIEFALNDYPDDIQGRKLERRQKNIDAAKARKERIESGTLRRKKYKQR